MGGTELMIDGLHRNVGHQLLDWVSIGVNGLPKDRSRPVICWIHHDIDQPAVQWLRDPATHSVPAAFVFVSHWQRERFEALFDLPPEKCHVLRNAIEWRDYDVRSRTGSKFVYTSTPFRGLHVLLDAWDIAGLGKRGCELHVYSSMSIYGQPEGPYEALYQRARDLEGVLYHGYQTNDVVRSALANMDFFAYPATWRETSCISAIEAMAAGCRLIVGQIGALPETTAGFADICRVMPLFREHSAANSRALPVYAEHFAEYLKSAAGYDPALQIAYTREMHSWENIAQEWRRLISAVTG
jgi:glycosyltransferase involved in cell wall biosynthesis